MYLALYARAQTVVAHLRSKLTREDGAVATEYALLLVLIALAIITAAFLLGQAIQAVFTEGSDTLNNGVPSVPQS
jgi:Flp pilus assembly pilin Flp